MKKKQIPKGKVIRVDDDTYGWLKAYKSVDPRASLPDAARKMVGAEAQRLGINIQSQGVHQ